MAIAGGTADIYDGDFSTVPCVNNPAHTTTSFYALYVAGESFENMATVYGGNFHAAYREAVHIGNSNPAPDSGAGKSSIVLIKGGTFTGGTLGGTAVVVENTDNAVGAASITGGTFSSDVSAYVPAGSAAVEDENGNFIIAPAADACFAIGNVGYNTLAEAVDAVPADGTQVTITMLKEAQGDGVVVKAGQNIVFDFGGHTYNINGALVGSAGTETNGMQFLKGSGRHAEERHAYFRQSQDIGAELLRSHIRRHEAGRHEKQCLRLCAFEQLRQHGGNGRYLHYGGRGKSGLRFVV